MPVYSSSPLDAVYLLAQTANTPRTISSIAAAKFTRHQSCTFTQNRGVPPAPFKTGTRTQLIGIPGRTSASFSWSGPLIPNGTPATAPDIGVFLQSAMGAVSSGSYSFADTVFLPFLLARFNKSGGSSPTNQICGGCIPTRLTITGGGDHLMLSVEGKAVAVCDSAQFSSYTGYDAVSKFTLGAFPSEPSASVNGQLINGFGGTMTLDGNSHADMRGTWSVVINTGLDFAEDGYSDGYPFAIVGGRRTVSLSNLHAIDNDGSTLNNLKAKSFTKAAMDMVIVANNVAGSIATITLKSVQLAPYQLVENGAAFDVNFGEAMAHGSALANVDDCVIAFT